MATYTLMLIAILLSSALVQNGAKRSFEQKRKLILKIGIFILWIMCALKHESVGIDIEGYKRVYEESARWEWFDYSKVYFEEGYILLMQLFSKNGLSFQAFNIFIYTVIYLPWYYFLKRYSKLPTLSLLIYICYQFWVFNMSGLRQGIAMSICLIAFMVLEKEKKAILRAIISIGLILLATTIHRSAIVFLIVLGVYAAKIDIKTISIFGICYFSCMLFRSYVVAFVNSIAGIYQVSQRMVLGGSFIMLVGFAIFIIYTNYNVHDESDVDVKIESSSAYMMLCSIALNLALNGSNMLRAASYASMFLTVALPSAIVKYERNSRILLCFIVGVFLIALYYHDVLMANQLNIIPYKFFWQ